MIPLSMPLSTPPESRSKQFGDNTGLQGLLVLDYREKENLFHKIVRVMLKNVQPSQTLDYSARRQLLRLTLGLCNECHTSVGRLAQRK